MGILYVRGGDTPAGACTFHVSKVYAQLLGFALGGFRGLYPALGVSLG